MNKKLKRKQALIMSEPYRTPFNSEVAKVNGDVIEDSVGEIKYATSFNGATKIEDANANKIRIEDGTYYIGKSVNLLNIPDKEETTTNGITYSIKDGIITINGTTDGTYSIIHYQNIQNLLEDGATYSFNDISNNDYFYMQIDLIKIDGTAQFLTKKDSFTWNTSVYSKCDLKIQSNNVATTFDNLEIKPILVSGSTIPTKYYSGSYGIKVDIADGVVTCNGNTTELTFYSLVDGLSGRYYSMSCFNNASSDDLQILYGVNGVAWNAIPLGTANASRSIDFLENQTNISFTIRVNPNTELDNAIIKPMLVLGSTAPTSFEPNFKNLLEIGDLSERTKDGLTYYYKNGMIVVNGTSNGGYTHIYDNSLGAENFEDGATYSFNDISNDNNLYLQFSLAKKDGTTQYLTKKNSFVWDSNIYSICYIAVQTAPTITTFNNIVIKPTFVKSSVIPSQFIPFANPYFVSLGQNGIVQYNGLEPREIDLKGNVISKINNQASDKLSNYALTKNTKVVDLGSFNWSDSNTQTSGIIRWASNQLASDILHPNATNIAPNLLCTRYDTITADQTFTKIKGITLDQFGNLIIYDPAYNTSDKLEEFKKAIRGTLLMYQTKNPTTINTTSFKTFKEDTNATISDDNFTSSPNAITETFKPTRSYDFKVNGFSNLIKSSNLFFLPNIASTTLLGLTYNASNQKMTVSGTSTQQYIVFYSKDMTDKMVVGKTYVLQCSSNSLSLILQASIKKTDGTYEYFVSYDNPKFTWASDYESVQISVQDSSPSGTTVNLSNVTFGLYETDNVSIPYEPYFDPYIESFADKKNLLELHDTKGTIAGVTYSIKNGVVALNGTPTGITSETWLWFDFVKTLNGSYSFNSFIPEEVSFVNGMRIILYDKKSEINFISLADGEKSATKTISNYECKKIGFSIYPKQVFKNLVFKLMFVEGNKIPTTFLPYQDKYSAFLNVKGKNLFDNVNTPIIFVTFSGSNQIVYRYAGNVSKVIYLKKGKYTFKSDKNMIIGKVINWTGDLGSKVGEVVKGFSATIELEKDMYVLITNNYRYEYNLLFETLIVVEGDQIPEYEPYYSFTKEVLIKQPLRKFDYLTYEGVYRQTNEIVLDGTNNLFMSDNGTIQVLNIPNVDSLNTDYAINYASQLMVTTSDLPLVPCRDIQVDAKKGIGTNNGVIYIKLDDSTDNSLNNWTVEKVNNYFKQNPITITYKTVDQTFEATSLTRLLLKNGYNKITPYDSINNNAIVEYLEYYKSKGD